MDSQTLLNRRDFIDRVNRWAEAHQAPGVTDRMLEDWNEEGIFPAGIPISGSNSGAPLRFYNWRHYFHALLICCLKKLGQERYAELRIALWFRGVEIPGGPPKNDLAAEFGRAVKALIRPINSSYEPTCGENENPTRAIRLLNQLGEQAQVFKGTILELSVRHILAGYKESRFGEPQKSLRDYENYVLDQFGFGLDTSAALKAMWPAGLMTHPNENENPGISLFHNSTNEELDTAREIYRAFLRLPELVGLTETLGLGGNLEVMREFIASIPVLKKSIPAIPAWRLFLLVNFLAFQKQGLGERD